MSEPVKPIGKVPSDEESAAPETATDSSAASSQGTASPQATSNRTTDHVPAAKSETAAPVRADVMPGMYINPDKFVVLSSRLGRGMVALPKIDPKNPNETVKYFTPEAFERGEQIERSDIADVPGIDNVERLLKMGAIGRYDHPDSMPAIQALEYRRAQEQRVGEERGIVATAHS
jgi:hypothetical protein